MQTLFFVLPVLIFIIGSTYTMRKNANGTSIYFFHPKLTEIDVRAIWHHSKCDTWHNLFFSNFKASFFKK
jgi:hypothetical protein